MTVQKPPKQGLGGGGVSVVPSCFWVDLVLRRVSTVLKPPKSGFGGWVGWAVTWMPDAPFRLVDTPPSGSSTS